MQEYTVQAGDTLALIAKRLLGSAGKWSVIAEVNGLTNPNKLKVGQILMIPLQDQVPVPEVINPVVAPESGQTQVSFTEEGGRVYANNPVTGDKIDIGKKYKLGLVRYGVFQPEDFLRSGDPLLSELQINDSEIRVLLPTAENEGAMDAINTWDNSFLSFGMFQWTAGRANEAGELPVLLAKIKDRYPDDFQHYFGQFGLDVEGITGAYGWFSLDGTRLNTEQDKQQLRDYAWVYRFMRAGADRNVQAVEALHAIERLDSFYFQSQAKFDGYTFAQMFSSEYAVSLLLDNHVNRPGYVNNCITAALEATNLTPVQVVNGDKTTEQNLLNAYLSVRETYGRSPMTHASTRAALTERYRSDGLLSDERDSFVSNRQVRGS